MKYDLAVIGGGPAGLMAALKASELGYKVVLLEKNQRLGIKLLMTGGGRCNITNNIPDYRLLASSFGPSGRFLLSAFSRFGAPETIEFFESRGLKTKIEKVNQVFPASDRAADVLEILIKGIEDSGGLIMNNSPVQKIILEKKTISKLIMMSGQEISAANYLIATGGLSYPSTGSTGDGYKWLRELGHTIKSLRPALTPILVKERFVKDLEGLSLENVSLRLYYKNKKIAQEVGPMIFTSVGLSGPAVLNISRQIDLSAGRDYHLEIDLQPQSSEDNLVKNLEKILAGNNRLLKNILEGLVSPRLAEIIITLSGLDSNLIGNSFNRLERESLVKIIKSWRFHVNSVEDYSRAMVTAGGVDLKEINSSTMRSKIISNLFIAGEILDLTGPTGGYNLQLCWSTGHLAGFML